LNEEFIAVLLDRKIAYATAGILPKEGKEVSKKGN
jgi:hypothetical protein